ncbi:hypothetical protein EGT74_02195 [Chitinophaga lutea]|uniref:Uncharacterized protein n=1 Tax=Chitinophaga lutea TaxID=2488634 RepID=A0A3N4PU87_9BACT|nr:hypothetical protein [Chitinophaga lutea]RPE12383.1 hypothetical protein EGT74_02195 [Chitinophaga lutea]
MKKVLILAVLFVTAIAAKAQKTSGPAPTSSMKVRFTDLLVSSIKLTEGTNTVRLPGHHGSIQLVKRGDSFSDVVFTDVNGRETRLVPNDGTSGAAEPDCDCPLPDACFSFPDSQQYGMCICKACDVKDNDDIYSIGLLLPAVQKVRDR